MWKNGQYKREKSMIDLGIIIGIISAIIAVIAAGISYRYVREQKRVTKINLNITQISEAESLIFKNPKLLELHNVSNDLLKQCDANHEEVCYLLLNFNAAQGEYLVENEKNISLSNYRKNLLNNEKVRKIWKRILRRKMYQKSRFTKAVDEYINEIEKDL